MSAAMSWIQDARRVGLEQVALELSLGLRRGRFDACPSCGGDACKAYNGDHPRWRCYRCSAHGDAIDLVSYAIAGGSLSRDSQGDVRAWYASRGWCEGEPGAEPMTTREVQIIQQLRHDERTYPPVEEVEAMFLNSLSPYKDDDAIAWLESRFAPGSVDLILDRGLCFVIPEGSSAPSWAKLGKKSWVELGYRLLFLTFDSEGDCRSVRARCLRDTPWPGAPKALPPAGHTVRGLVLSNSYGRSMLRGQNYPASVVIAEGEPQWLACCLAWPRAAVFGVVAGAWTSELAAKIPLGADVLICTDHDEAGDQYAAKITRSLHGRARVLRHLRSLGVQ